MRAIPSCAARQPGRDGDPSDGRISLPRTETCIAHHRLHTKAHNQIPAEKLALLAGFEANPGPRNAAIRRSRCLPQPPRIQPAPARVPLGDRPVTAIRTPWGRACGRPWDRLADAPGTVSADAPGTVPGGRPGTALRHPGQPPSPAENPRGDHGENPGAAAH